MMSLWCFFIFEKEGPDSLPAFGGGGGGGELSGQTLPDGHNLDIVEPVLPLMAVGLGGGGSGLRWW